MAPPAACSYPPIQKRMHDAASEIEQDTPIKRARKPELNPEELGPKKSHVLRYEKDVGCFDEFWDEMGWTFG